jgi:hypothetical protein
MIFFSDVNSKTEFYGFFACVLIRCISLESESMLVGSVFAVSQFDAHATYVVPLCPYSSLFDALVRGIGAIFTAINQT